MKKILVTGSNKGIGFEVVRQLAQAGHHVLLAARDATRGSEAAARLREEKITVTSLVLDVADPISIEQAAGYVKAEWGRLDVLINNAAVLLKEDQSLASGAADVFHKTMRTNVFGPVAVTRALLPLMSAGARIIMTSSGGGSMTDPVGGWSPVYCVSKSSLNAATRHLAYELSSRNISVNAYCPGWVRTDMGGKSAPRSVEQGADTAVWLATVDLAPTGKFFRDRREIPW
ncbi:MAG: SDR family oxidoreductase [Cyclobacteriaceae bacterium]|jgi:NAD(P)-dependent dehydrogenase (short-subunit alcohol dehydrogenase family)